MKIFLGPSGSPGKTTIDGLAAVRAMGLDAMELSFTHGVRMGIETAKQIGEANKKTKLKLSIHAPYYINLCSEKPAVRKDSIRRILDTCERAHYIGAEKVVFHPAYYGKMPKDECFAAVKDAVNSMMDLMRSDKWNVQLAPETTGRLAQFGTLEETIRLSDETGCSFCIDIAHIYARNGGKINYGIVFDSIGRSHVHFHFEGIQTNKGGEGRHLVIEGNNPDFRQFAAELLKRDMGATIISESPVTWQDSLRMKKILEELGHIF
jgi:deoxyribonuclease-4